MSPSRLGRVCARAYAKRSTGRTRLSSATGRGDRASPSTEQGACVQAVSEDPAIEVASVRWERVQLIVEARTVPGTPVDPASLRLVPDGGGEPMAPTRATIGRRPTDDPLQRPGRAGTPAAGARPVDAGRRASVAAPDAGGTAGSRRRRHLRARARHGTGDATDRCDRAPPDPGRRVRRDRPAHDRGATGRSVRIRRAVFRALVSISRLVRRRGRHRVLFASRLISEMSGNLKVVHDRMVERGTRPRP